MADNKIKIDIEAVDNFSKIIDELNKKLKQLQTKQGKIEPVRISGINKQLDELERRFDNLNRGQLARMPSDKIQYEIRSMLKQVNDLYKSVEDALNKLSTKTVNKGKNLNIAKKELVEFDGQDVVKEMKKYKDIIAKALNIEVKPTLDKKSIEDTKKKVKEEFKDNKVTQKVTVETEMRAKDTTKEKVKPTETKTKKETVEEEKPKRGRKKKEEAPKIEAPQQQTVAQTVKTEVKAEVDKSSVQKAVKDIQKEVDKNSVKAKVDVIPNKEQLAKTATTVLLGDMPSKNEIADIKNSLLQKALGSSVPQQEQKKPVEAVADKKVQIPAEVKVDKPSVVKAVKEAQEAVKTISIEEKPKQADFSDAVERKLRARAYANQAFGIKSSGGQLGEKAYNNFVKSILNDDAIDKDEFRRKLKELEDKAKVDVKPQVKKETIQEVQKQTQKELDKKPVEQKVKPQQDTTTTQKGNIEKKVQEAVKKVLPTKEAVNTASKAVSNLVGNVVVDETALSKSLDKTIKNINKEPRTIKLGKDEKYFKKVLDDNIKKANKDNLEIKAKIGKISFDKEALNKFNKELNIKAIINSIKINEEKLQKIKDKVVRINAEITNVKVNPDSLATIKDKTINIKGVIKPLTIDKEALDKLKEKEIKLSGVVSGVRANVKAGSQGTKNKGVEPETKVKDDYKTLLRQRNAAVVAMDKAWQQAGGNDKNAQFLKARKDYFNAQDKLMNFQSSSGLAGVDKVIRDLERRLSLFSSDSKSPIKAAMEKKLSEAYTKQSQLQNQSPKGLEQLTVSTDNFVNSVVKLAQSLDNARTRILDYENKVRAAVDKSFVDKAIADDLYKTKHQDVINKANKKTEEARIKEAYASDAHETDLINKKKAAENKAIAEQAAKEVEQQKLLNKYLDDEAKRKAAILKQGVDEEIREQKLVNKRQEMLELMAKEAAAWNRVERARDRILAQQDKMSMKNYLQQQATDAIGKPLNTTSRDNFLVDLQMYRDMTNDMSTNFYKKMGQVLRIGKDHPYFEALQKLHKESLEAAKAWNESEKKKEESTKSSAQNIKNQYQSLAQKAKEYALDAEKAWRMQGNQTSPVFDSLREQFHNAMQNLVNYRRSLGNLSAGAEANVYANMARSLGKASPMYDELIRKAKQLKKEQKEINDAIRAGGSGRTSGTSGAGTGGVGGLLGFLSNLFGGTTAFVGRALKGTGSFLEAVSKATMAVGKLGTAGMAISVVVGGITAAASALVGVFSAVSNAAQILGNVLMQIGRTIFQVLQPGIKLYEQQQHAIFSFTAALQTHGVLDENVPNIGGQRLSALGDEGREIARGLSAELIQRATLDAEMSAFSLEELLRSMQGTLPLLLSRGMSLDQAYEVNKGVAGVAKMTQLSPNQILQETRDLAQGTISSRSSQVANALGISSADIEKYKGDAEGLFNFLMERFKAYGEMLAEFEDTAIGRWQQLQERYQNVTKNIVEGIAPMFKGVFEEIIAWTGEWKDKNGNYLDAIAGVWKDKNGEIIGTIKEVTEAQDHLGVDRDSAKFIPSEELQKIKQALIEIIVYVAGIADAIIAWGSELLGTTDPIEIIKQLILDIAQAFMLCVSILGAFIQNFATIYATAAEFVDVILSVVQVLIFIKSIFKGIGLFLVNIVKLSISVFRIFTNLGQLLNDNITPLVHALYDNIYNIVRMVKAIISGDISGAASIGLEVANNVKNQYKESITTDINDIISSIDSGIDAAKGIFVDPVKSGIEGGMQYLQVENLRKKLEGVNTWDKVLGTVSGFQPINGKWQQAVQKYTEASEKAKQQASSGGVKATDVRGIPKEDDKKAAQEAKKALKEAQKALKEELQRLKEELKDKLDELKDAQERDDIAYKEGFMSMKDYFTNKAAREAEEARLRLEEAVAERDLIDKTPFESEYDRQKELHKVNREIREYTRALEKSNRQLGEVTNQIGKYNQSMKVMQELQRQPIQTMMYGGQQAGMGGTLSVTGQQALEQWGEKNGIAGWIVDEVINRGVNTWGRSAATEKLIKLTLAAMKQESGGSQNAISPAGAIGLMQLMPETAAGLGVNPYDWSENIFGGMKYYHQQLETFGGSIEKALAAYNAGPGAVQKYGGVPPYRETQNYVRIIKDTFDEMKNFPKLFDNRVGQIATSLGVTVNDVNKELGRLGQAIETLVSSTGELLGYKAPQQYSRGGIDTRFSRFQSMSGGVDTQISGLKPQVIQAINLVAKEFFEKTGQQIEWSSFTGSNLHKQGEWGHYAGWKADANIDPKYYEILKQILGKLGIGAGVEAFGTGNQHVDISFAKGGVGGDILTTLTGTAFYNKLNNAVTSNGINVLLPQEQKKEIISDEFRNKIASDLGVASDKKMQDLFDSIYQANPDTTKGGYELRNERFDRLQKLWELRAKNTSRVAGNTQEARMVLMIKYLRQMSEARSDPEMYNELDLAHQLEELDLVTEQLSKFADINLADIENKLKLDDYRLQLGEIDATSVASRIAQALTDKNDPLGLAKTIEDLEKQYADYISRGAREDAQRVQSKLQSIRKTVLDYFDKLRESVVQPWDMSQKIFNAMSKYTSTQREFAEREFTAHRSQAELAVVDLRISEANVELEKTTQNITRLQDKLNSLNADNVAAEMANLKESQAGLNLELENEKKLYDDLQKKLNEYDKVNKEIAKTKAELESAQNLEKTIQLQQKLNLQQKELLEIQKQMPNYLKDIQDAANEALDKGLNEMLTDGVNSAKSLGELLKDLAVTVLKEIQRVSAKWMVKNIMNKLVGHFYVDEKGNSQMALLSTTQALVKSNYDLLATNQALVQTLGGTIGNEFGTIPQQSTQFKSVNGILDVNNPFESPWQQSSLNPNAQSPQQQYTFNTPNILDTVSLPENVKNFNVALGEASTNKLPGFNTEIENVANSLTKGNSLESATQQISTQTSTVFSNILTQLQQAGMSIVMELNRIATQLRNITFGGSNNNAYTGGLVKGGRILRLAKGGAVYKNTGLVRGTGTSTSDDIPAMLSNGEAVLNAKAVKKLGVNFISAVNNGEFSKIRATLPHFAEGGFVGEAQQSTARGMTDFAKGVGTEISTNNNVNIALVRDEQEAMREFLKSPAGERVLADFSKKSAHIFWRS